MPIVSSTYTLDAHEQRGGGRYVVERHTDDAGRVHQIGPYIAADEAQAQARMAARVALLDEQLAEAEANALLGDGA